MVGLGTLMTGWGFYEVYSEEAKVSRTLKQFERGFISISSQSGDPLSEPYMARPEEKEMRDFIRPPDNESGSYYLLWGSHGTGKTTLVSHVAKTPQETLGKAKPDGVNGVIFIDVSDVSETNPLLSSLNQAVVPPFWPFMLLDVPPSTGQVKTLAEWRRVVTKAAVEFRRKHGRPATLVIDATEKLAKRAIKFDLGDEADLVQLLELGKENKGLVVILVSSDYSTSTFIKTLSVGSRMKEVELGDVEDPLAVEFLVDNGIAKAEAEVAVRNYTGGRFRLLRDYVDDRKKMSREAIVHNAWVDVNRIVRDNMVPFSHPILARLVHGRLLEETIHQGLGATALDALLKANIISYHPSDGQTYTFHSRFHVRFFEAFQVHQRRYEEEKRVYDAAWFKHVRSLTPPEPAEVSFRRAHGLVNPDEKASRSSA